MSEMTAMRIAGGATLTGAWIVVAWLLWRTSVPDLDVPELEPDALFGAATIDRNGHYRDVATGIWAAGVSAQLIAIAVLVRRRPDPPLRPLAAGALLGGVVFA